MTVCKALLLLPLLLAPMVGANAATAPAKTADSASSPQTSATLQISDKTEVPGAVLKPGTYTIAVLDHLQDRSIVRITGPTERPVIFLGLPARTSAPSGSPLTWTSGTHAQSALRGFAFPNGRTLEFVYPKDTAVALAKANGTEVYAIDPASEGKVKLPKMSQQDMATVTLWILSPTKVGPDSEPGIAAQRYVPATLQQNVSAPAPATGRNAQGTQEVASLQPPPPVHTTHLKALPHTASDTPVLLLAALLALSAAAALRLKRIA